MTSILTITGWSLIPESLQIHLPEADALDYRPFSHIDEVASYCAHLNRNWDIVVAWSLGAQIACRLIAAGVLLPQRLVLIAPPFQHVSKQQSEYGMAPFIFESFRNGYASNPEKTLRKFALMNHDSTQMVKYMQTILDSDMTHHSKWLHWLDELGAFSCDTLDFKQFPPTTLIHAKDDQVVSIHQIKAFQRVLPRCELVVLEDGGHIPHLHDGELLKRVTGLC